METPQYTLIRAWIWRMIVVFLLVALLLQVVEVKSNVDIDALMTLKNAMTDPQGCFKDWDPTLVNPCIWLRITCNSDNRVTRVDVGGCGLSGQLPTGLVGLDQLQYLNLYINNIGGSIPTQYGHNFKNLVALDLYSNLLSGIIPASLAQLPSILIIRLEENQLDGEIPRDLGRIPTLRRLNISSNNLCGDVPPEIAHNPAVELSNNPGLGKPCP